MQNENAKLPWWLMSQLVTRLKAHTYAGPNTIWQEVAADYSDPSIVESMLVPFGISISFTGMLGGPASVKHAMAVQPNIAGTVKEGTCVPRVPTTLLWNEKDRPFNKHYNYGYAYHITEQLLGWATIDGLRKAEGQPQEDGVVNEAYFDMSYQGAELIPLIAEMEAASLELTELFYQRMTGGYHERKQPPQTHPQPEHISGVSPNL